MTTLHSLLFTYLPYEVSRTTYRRATSLCVHVSLLSLFLASCVIINSDHHPFTLPNLWAWLLPYPSNNKYNSRHFLKFLQKLCFLAGLLEYPTHPSDQPTNINLFNSLLLIQSCNWIMLIIENQMVKSQVFNHFL